MATAPLLMPANHSGYTSCTSSSTTRSAGRKSHKRTPAAFCSAGVAVIGDAELLLAIKQGRSSGGRAAAAVPVRRPCPTPIGPRSNSFELAPAHTCYGISERSPNVAYHVSQVHPAQRYMPTHMTVNEDSAPPSLRSQIC